MTEFPLITGLGCWSDAFRLHPRFVPAGPRDVKSLKTHHIFTISAAASELVLFLARCGAPADRAVRSAGSVDSVGHSCDKVYSIHDWACAFIGNRVESKVSKHIIAA
ncbi:MAG: hypothetical protein ACOYOL_13210 [Chthoniobacterales bacterium]